MTEIQPGYLLNALVWAVTGVILFAGAFAALAKMIPLDIWAEVRDNRNIAAAILLGALAIALAIVIASTVH